MQIDIAERQFDGLGYTQTCCIHDFKQGFVAQSMRRFHIRSSQQRVDLGFGNQLGQFAFRFRRLEKTGGIVCPLACFFQPAVHALASRQCPRLGRVFFPLRIHGIRQDKLIGTQPILPALGQTRSDFDQITAVTLQRIVAESVLQPKGFKQFVY